MRRGLVAGASALLLLFAILPQAAFAAHVQCGDTITSSTRLDSDLTNCPGDGVVIGADGIRLDLNGHTIDGTGTGNGIDNSAGFDRVRVKDGTVKEFGSGFLANGADRVRIDGLDTSANATSGIALGAGKNNVVEDGVTTQNGRYGVELFDGGTRTRIDDMAVSNNGTHGVFITRGNFGSVLPCEHNAVVGSDVTDNGFQGLSGIRIDRCTATRVAANRLRGSISFESSNDNSAYGNEVTGAFITIIGDGNSVRRNRIQTGGISMVRAHGNLAAENVVLDSPRSGVTVNQGTGNQIRWNRVLRSGEDGIILIESDQNVLSSNTIAGSARNGVLFNHPGLEGDGSDSNRIAWNIVRESGDGGINLQEDSDDPEIVGNVVRDSGFTGIYLSQFNLRAIVERNVVVGNTGGGIFMSLVGEGRVNRNRVADSSGFGIFISGIVDGSVSGNYVTGSTLSGIICNNCHRNVIAYNTLTENVWDGLTLQGSQENEIRRNRTERNDRGGITLNQSRGDVVSQNRSLDNAGAGILLFGFGTSNVLIERNATHRNQGDGVHLATSGSTVTSNTANDNVDLGIEVGNDARLGTIDGGGNRAAGNGNPLQCVGVVCE